MDKFYVTTSIAYTNASPHIGFALELIQADVLARHNRKKGKDTFFLTGTDEHGQKIARKAKEEGKDPQQFVDDIVQSFDQLIKDLNISNDDFIRTTDKERHWPTAQALWKEIEEQGDLYKKKYTGRYCVGCEAFLTEKDLVDGKCPNHDTEPEKVEEENYFFKLSEYEEEIKDLIESDELNIIPESKKNEMLSFIDDGLEDVSVSRSEDKLKWGVPVPDDENQRMYVWVDALSNYISALGYAENKEEFEKFWPADVHCIGKDILRFHSIIWIGLLLSAGLEIPKNIFVHGFITSKGKKMSKSLGNVVDPFELLKEYGTDPVRYYLLSEIPPTGDGDFTAEKFKDKYNSDLADGLGNLISRTIGLATKKDVEFDKDRRAGGEIMKKVSATKKKTNKLLDNYEFKKALEEIWSLIHFMDRYIEEKKPWEESWDQEKVIFEMLYVCYQLHKLLAPFLPETAEKIKNQIETQEKEILFQKL
ncbi:MAG: methionine--tRNA ligase [Patescibacteria group bacterium]